MKRLWQRLLKKLQSFVQIRFIRRPKSLGEHNDFGMFCLKKTFKKHFDNLQHQWYMMSGLDKAPYTCYTHVHPTASNLEP